MTPDSCSTHALPQGACVIDMDNLTHRGFDNRTGHARRHAQLDILGLASALRESGVERGTMCRNWDLPALAEQLWTKLGFKVIASRRNCDPEVIAEALRYADAGFSQLTICSGDAGFTETVNNLRKRGIRVDIWTRQATASARLVNAADSVRYIDDFFVERAAPNSRDSARQPFSAISRQSWVSEKARSQSNHGRLRAPQFGIKGRIIPLDYAPFSPTRRPGPTLCPDDVQVTPPSVPALCA